MVPTTVASNVSYYGCRYAGITHSRTIRKTDKTQTKVESNFNLTKVMVT